MGYTTDFSGEFKLNKPLSVTQVNYLTAFARTRRMKRKSSVVEKMNDSARLSVKLPVGLEGEFFVGSTNDYGQDHDSSVVDYNSPPKTQPGLWCQWVPTVNGDGIEWDGGEKFYNYVEWLEYIVDNFLKPWGFTLNGEVKWVGEDHEDMGKIVVKNNVVTARKARVQW